MSAEPISSSAPLAVAVHGAAGRMGRTLIDLILSQPRQFMLAAAVVSAGDPRLGQDVGDWLGTARLEVPTVTLHDLRRRRGMVLVDFTNSGGLRDAARWAGEVGVALVTGTTGVDEATETALAAAAARVPVLAAANMSIGVALMRRLVQEAATALGPGFDIEIQEAHHRQKRDAPSGTALMLGRAASEARGQPFRAPTTLDRSGSRPDGTIGYAVTRGGQIVGEHTVLFAGPFENLRISHQALDRRLFAAGALRAAKWVQSQAPGLYRLDDMLRVAFSTKHDRGD